MTRQVATSSSAHRRRWRPACPDRKRLPVCGYTWENRRCRSRGNHYCEPRADRVVGFFRDVLVHTKGVYARRRFELDPWQEHDIVRPVFGEVEYSPEYGCYVRRIRVLYIVVARKNGKSELAAGIVLYLLVADDEEGAEIYGAAKDTKQAAKVWQPAKRMVQLSPVLRRRLKVNLNAKRIYDERTDSYYEIIPGADALGELGHNPHGFVLDEVLSQPNRDLWDAMATASGTRTQPLNVLLTTETNDPNSFGAALIDEAERVADDPTRSPHSHAYVRKTPDEADPWDEQTWPIANPALGSFLSVEALRKQALDAHNDPQAENAFRQFRLNQRVNAATRWLTSILWRAGAGLAPAPDKLSGRVAYGGLDLSATSDLTALTWLFPDRYTDGTGPVESVARYWATEASIPVLSKATSGAFDDWITAGLVTVTDGDAIDYESVWSQLERDAASFAVEVLGLDRWNSQSTVNWCDKNGIEAHTITQGYPLTAALKEIERLLKDKAYNHGGNPVTTWCAECTAIRRRPDDEAIKLVKPDRDATGKRIDGIASLSFAVDRWLLDLNTPRYNLAEHVY